MAFRGMYERGIILTTMPKAGTHLLRQVVERVSGRKSALLKKFTDLAKIDHRDAMRHGHVRYRNPSGFDSSKWLALVLIRDPRDVVLSMRDYLETSGRQDHRDAYATIASLSFDEQLKAIIDGISLGRFSVAPIGRHCRGFVEWASLGGSIFRYEDLLSGDTAARMSLILGCEQAAVEEALSAVVGRNSRRGADTLNRGVSGRWRTEMSEDVLNHYYARCESIHVRLGYS